MKNIINFPTKKYTNANKYFKDYIDIKNLLLQNVDQKVLLKITNEILHTNKKIEIFSRVVMEVLLLQLNI